MAGVFARTSSDAGDPRACHVYRLEADGRHRRRLLPVNGIG